MKTLCKRSGVSFGARALLGMTAGTACTRQEQQAPPATTAAAAASPAATDAPIPATASPLDALPEAVRLVADKPFTGDLDEILISVAPFA